MKPEKWEKEFDVTFSKVSDGFSSPLAIFDTSRTAIKDFIRKTRQEAKSELIDGLIEWAEKNSKETEIKDFEGDYVIRQIILKDDLIHHLKSLK